MYTLQVQSRYYSCILWCQYVLLGAAVDGSAELDSSRRSAKLDYSRNRVYLNLQGRTLKGIRTGIRVGLEYGSIG